MSYVDFSKYSTPHFLIAHTATQQQTHLTQQFLLSKMLSW